MSIEKNLNEVKDKLTKDQNLLVSAFKLETFYKKYKKIIFLAIAFVIAFGVYKGIAMYQEYRIKVLSNTILNKLYDNKIIGEDKKAIEKELLDTNPILYDFYQYNKLQNLSTLQLKSNENLAILQQLSRSNDLFISSLASYQYATLTENIQMLQDFESNISPILQDRAKIQVAYMYMKDNDIKKANEILDSIKSNTNNQFTYRMALLLKHYGITKLNAIKKNN